MSVSNWKLYITINYILIIVGSNDADDLIVQTFKAYENEERKIEDEMFRHGEKYNLYLKEIII